MEKTHYLFIGAIIFIIVASLYVNFEMENYYDFELPNYFEMVEK